MRYSHLDMTTHNHASPMANEAAPTVYIDEMEVAFPKSCAKLVAQQNTHCSGAKQLYNDNGEPAGMDCNKACKAARNCLFPPYDKSKQFCCAPETTGHHVIPKAEFLQVGGGAALNTAVSGYKPDKAPCVCAEGYSWHTRDNALSLRPLKLTDDCMPHTTKSVRVAGCQWGTMHHTKSYAILGWLPCTKSAQVANRRRTAPLINSTNFTSLNPKFRRPNQSAE